ncbi:hypothetical protein IEQ34_011989 [Dendrobium chrysotoxum]|uniref:Uncharacterized protein n=1 Tax=Dendrobium chrysotoxum TaxID=161865 RepID=A0AAV7GSU1_DENCH|nr:hypothetical protein IEQ34_011989 [Dendrobium chrysotoxum]
METKICASNVSDQYNRFMIIKQIVKEKIKPMMTIKKIVAANRINSERLCGREGQAGEGNGEGNIRPGFDVMVHYNYVYACKVSELVLGQRQNFRPIVRKKGRQRFEAETPLQKE